MPGVVPGIVTETAVAAMKVCWILVALRRAGRQRRGSRSCTDIFVWGRREPMTVWGQRAWRLLLMIVLVVMLTTDNTKFCFC